MISLINVINKEKTLEVKEAIINYQYGEKVKSCLIIATKLMGILDSQSGERLQGGQEILKAYLASLITEIRIATNTTKTETLEEAEAKVQEAIGDLQLGDYAKAGANLSQAISKATTCCHRAMIKLKDENLI